MSKPNTDLDDYDDPTRPPLIDWVERLLTLIFAVAGPAMVVYLGWLVARVG